MAGRKQHYIPQSFLKGFEAPSKGSTQKVWVFRKGQQAFISPTQDVAAQRDFYSEPTTDGSLTLDDRITNYETELAGLLTALQEIPDDTVVDSNIAAEIITHLTIRGAHLRDVFCLGANRLIDSVTDIFTDEDNTRRLLGINSDEPTSIFLEEIEKTLIEHANLFTQIGLPKNC